MILTKEELLLIKPALGLVQQDSNLNVVVRFTAPGNLNAGPRCVTVDISAAGVSIKSLRNREGPAIEHFRSPMGIALAYRVALAKITNQNEGE